MKRVKFVTYAFGCLMSLSTMTVYGHAALYTQSFSRTLKLGDNLPEGLDVATVSVARFDAAWGNLDAVTVSLASEFTGGAVYYHPTLSLTFGYTPRHYLAVEASGLDQPPDFNLDHTLPTQTYTDTTPFGGSFWTPTAHEFHNVGFGVPAAEVGQYVGDDPFELTITIEDRSLYSASNPLAYINDKYVISDLILTVAYLYSPVPEADSWVLLLAAISPGGWVLRRKAKRVRG